MGLDVKEMQEIELDMLKTVHKFIKDHDLRYYLLGGSMLGAVRHGGFIPWDDDIDIGMPRKDFERFVELYRELPKPLELKYFRNTPSFVYNYIKIENSKTCLIETALKHLNIRSGVFIDVFPLDGVPQKWLTRKLHLLRIRLVAIMRLFCLVDKKKERNIVKKVGAIFVQRIFSIELVMRELDKLMKKYDFDECDIIANYAGAWGKREFMPKSYVGKQSACVFEGFEFSGVEKPHEYLSHIYGDYMRLPPEEKRCSHHKFEAYNIE